MNNEELMKEILATLNPTGPTLEEYLNVTEEQSGKIHDIVSKLDIKSTEPMYIQWNEMLRQTKTPNELMYMLHAMGSYLILLIRIVQRGNY